MTEHLGSLGPVCRKNWVHFNLREQSELLQLLLLLIHQTGQKELADFTSLSTLFSSHEFGSKQQFQSEMEEQSSRLVEGVGQLEAACLLLIMDLSTIPTSPNHPLFPATGSVASLERFISGLGNLPAHGPPMLAYMLGKYLSQGQQSLSTSMRYGEAAIGGNVLRTLLAILQGDFNRSLVSDILHSLVYSLISALVGAFDPVSLGLGVDIHSLIVHLLSHQKVADHFWKLPSEGLGLYVDSLKANYPLDHRPLVEVFTSLARASSASCTSVLSSLCSLPTFTDSADLLPSSARSLGSSTVELTEAYYPYPGTRSVCLPAGTRGSMSQSGTSVTWRPDSTCNGWQMMLADCGHLASQATSGAGGISLACLTRVTSSAQLVAAVLATDPSLAPQLSQVVCCKLFFIMNVFVKLNVTGELHPPSLPGNLGSASGPTSPPGCRCHRHLCLTCRVRPQRACSSPTHSPAAASRSGQHLAAGSDWRPPRQARKCWRRVFLPACLPQACHRCCRARLCRTLHCLSATGGGSALQQVAL